MSAKRLKPECRRRLFRQMLKKAIAYSLPDRDIFTTPLEFSKTNQGKPKLNCKSLEFSVSHSGNLFAVASHPSLNVGLDIQQFRPDKSYEFIHDFLDLDKQYSSTRLVQHWTKYEALIKVLGANLDLKLNPHQQQTMMASSSTTVQHDGEIQRVFFCPLFLPILSDRYQATLAYAMSGSSD